MPMDLLFLILAGPPMVVLALALDRQQKRRVAENQAEYRTRAAELRAWRQVQNSDHF